jgi:hypothetical protein
MESRATAGWVAGLDTVAIYVLKAAGDTATALGNSRLTLDQLEERLATATRISRRKIEASLGPLCDGGYLIADDAPGNSQIVLHLTARGVDIYCRQLLPGFGRIEQEILQCACADVGIDVYEISRRTCRAEFLIEHVLSNAEVNGQLRLGRKGQYIVVRYISPQLRRWVSGAA